MPRRGLHGGIANGGFISWMPGEEQRKRAHDGRSAAMLVNAGGVVVTEMARDDWTGCGTPHVEVTVTDGLVDGCSEVAQLECYWKR